MALAVGNKAPDFSLPTKTADGPKQIKLSDNFGKQNTLLLFFPMAFTGTCTTEMCSLTPELPNYAGMNDYERKQARAVLRERVRWRRRAAKIRQSHSH